MVEHRAVPDAARRERRGGEKPGARSTDGARGSPSRADPADAYQSRHQVADGVGVERPETFEADGDHIEKAAIQIEVPEMEQGLIGKPACVVANDELPVALLHFLIVGNRVVAEGEGDDND